MATGIFRGRAMPALLLLPQFYWLGIWTLDQRGSAELFARQPTAFLPIALIGQLLLWVAAVLTLITGYDYLRIGLGHLSEEEPPAPARADAPADRKSTRLNSSHSQQSRMPSSA